MLQTTTARRASGLLEQCVACELQLARDFDMEDQSSGLGYPERYVAKVMSMTKTDPTSLSDAIESGDVSTVTSLIQQHPELVNHPDWTPPPLHCAVLWNQPKIAELLLDNGADIEKLDPDRQTTPLRYAIMYCKTDLIPVLLFRGANTGPIVHDGPSAFQLAQDCASGAYEEFDDLPTRDAYNDVVTLLKHAGLTE